MRKILLSLVFIIIVVGVVLSQQKKMPVLTQTTSGVNQSLLTQDYAICFGQTMKLWMSNRGCFGINALGDGIGGCNGMGLEYPAGSNIEHLFGAGLWIGAIIDTSTDNTPKKVKAVTTAYEGWNFPLFEMYGSPDGRDSFFTTSIDNPDGRNQLHFDDDGDGRTDEDELDGVDNDNDGRIDEDFGAVSEQDAYVSYSDTIKSPPQSGHVPLGIKVWQKAYSWKNSIKDPILPIEFYIVNVGTKTLDSVYVGFFADLDLDSWCNYICIESSGFLADVRTGYTLNLEDRFVTPMGVTILEPPRPFDSLKFNFRAFFGNESPNSDEMRYEFMSEGVITPDQFPSIGDTRFLISFGPIRNFKPGDTLHFSIAFVSGFGIRQGDIRNPSHSLYDNAARALALYDRKFTTAPTPPSPPLKVTTEFNKVTLDWKWRPGEPRFNPLDTWDSRNNFLSSLPDSHWRRRNPPPFVLDSTGGRVFEGFRLYRSEYPEFDSTKFVLLRQYDVVDEIDTNYQTGLQYTYVDSLLSPGRTYWYSVTSYSIPDINVVQYVDTNRVIRTKRVNALNSRESVIRENATAVTVSKEFRLYQSYPNPFNSSTKIIYEIPLKNNVSLAIYDVLGRQIAHLVDEFKFPGRHEVEWDASALASGVYFYQMRAGNFVDTKKLLLIR
jgi:hypothetical protein